MDLALNNNLQRLICHEKPTNQPTNQPTNRLKKRNRGSEKSGSFRPLQLVRLVKRVPGDLRRLAVTLTSVEDHQLTLW